MDRAWIEKYFKTLSDIGWTDQGRDCLAYTHAETVSHYAFLHFLGEMGLTGAADDWGNCYATWVPPGVDPDTPAVVIGSHLDSVPQGGRFDGVLGVAVAIGLVEQLQKLPEQALLKLKRPLRVVAWRGEESSRFKVSCIGSKGASGLLGFEEAKQFYDARGLSLYDAMEPYRGTSPSPVAPGTVKALLELHIEQGPVLANIKQQQKKPVVGVVNRSIAGAVRETLELAHSWGREPDALIIAKIFAAVYKVAKKRDALAQPFRATFTPLQCAPNVGREQTTLHFTDQETLQSFKAWLNTQDIKYVQDEELVLMIQTPHSFHTGTQPMCARFGLDALLTAAVGLNAIKPDQSVIWPDFMARDTIKLQLDYRGVDDSLMQGIDAVHQCVAEILKETAYHAVWHRVSQTMPTKTTPRIAKIMQQCAEAEGITAISMASGAGHDLQMPLVPERGLLFVVSEAGGVSHHRSEYTKEEDLHSGARVLYRVVYQLLMEPNDP
ncbi:M20/M25/M40 family metallo-hydrolase [Magnetococcales bacterium HHB-1]